MEFFGTQVSGGALVALTMLGVLVLAAIVATLVDLARHDVRHLPKWAWALVIVLVNFPIGVIIYFLVGRIPPGQEPPRAAASTASAPPASAEVSDPAPPVAPTTFPTDDIHATTGEPVISTHGLGKLYGDAAALHDVDLRVPRGAVYGLIGPNGAGKTTLLSILAGLRRASLGEVEIRVPRRSIGVLVDTPDFEPWLTAREVVELSRGLTAPDAPAEAVDRILTETGLADALDRRVGGFSRGMRQRLGLAACLVGDPEVLILDEPSSALDPAGRREVLDLIGRLADTKTVLLSTHILADVQSVCDVVGVIDGGRLRYQGPLAELLSRTSSVYTLHVRADGQALASTLTQKGWVQSVDVLAPGRLRLVVSDATHAETEIPALLAQHDAPLVSFAPAADLETAFLELTS